MLPLLLLFASLSTLSFAYPARDRLSEGSARHTSLYHEPYWSQHVRIGASYLPSRRDAPIFALPPSIVRRAPTSPRRVHMEGPPQNDPDFEEPTVAVPNPARGRQGAISEQGGVRPPGRGKISSSRASDQAFAQDSEGLSMAGIDLNNVPAGSGPTHESIKGPSGQKKADAGPSDPNTAKESKKDGKKPEASPPGSPPAPLNGRWNGKTGFLSSDQVEGSPDVSPKTPRPEKPAIQVHDPHGNQIDPLETQGQGGTCDRTVSLAMLMEVWWRIERRLYWEREFGREDSL